MFHSRKNTKEEFDSFGYSWGGQEVRRISDVRPFRLLPRTGPGRDTLVFADKSYPLTATAPFVISVLAVRTLRGVASVDLGHHDGNIGDIAEMAVQIPYNSF